MEAQFVQMQDDGVCINKSGVLVGRSFVCNITHTASLSGEPIDTKDMFWNTNLDLGRLSMRAERLSGYLYNPVSIKYKPSSRLLVATNRLKPEASPATGSLI